MSSRSFHWSWLRFFRSHSVALSSAVFVPLAKDGGRRTHSSQFAVGWSWLLQCLQHCRVQMAVIETILLLDFCQYLLLLSDDQRGTSLDASHRPLRVVIQLFYGTSNRSQCSVSQLSCQLAPIIARSLQSFRLTRNADLPKKIEEACKKLKYVDYALLARSSREGAKEEHAITISGGRFEMLPTSMTPEEEGDIRLVDWLAAAKTVEEAMLKFHGQARCNALKAHHQNVLEISRTYDWPAARFYDKRIRQLSSKDPHHDLSCENQKIVTEAVSWWRNKQNRAEMHAQQPQLSRPSSSQSFASTSSFASGPLSTKRFAPYDQSSRQARQKRQDGKCFRCGVSGHMVASCDSKTTTAGITCTSWQRPLSWTWKRTKDKTKKKKKNTELWTADCNGTPTNMILL